MSIGASASATVFEAQFGLGLSGGQTARRAYLPQNFLVEHVAHPLQDPVSRWLRRRSAVTFVALLLAASFVTAVGGFALVPPDEPSAPLFEVTSPGWGLLLAVLVIPVFETAVFQWVPIRKLGFSWRWAIPLSAALFGLSHWYSPSDMLVAFLTGLVFAYGFAVRDPIDGKPFLLVAIAHGVHNLVATMLS